MIREIQKLIHTDYNGSIRSDTLLYSAGYENENNEHKEKLFYLIKPGFSLKNLLRKKKNYRKNLFLIFMKKISES